MLAAIASVTTVVLVACVAGRVGDHVQRRRISARLRPISYARRSTLISRITGVHRLVVTRRTHPPMAEALAGVLDAIARRCASGESLAHAFDICAAESASRELQHARRRLHSGHSLAESLSTPSAGTTHPALVLAMHVIHLCATEGGNVAESLDRAAASLRERHADERERWAHGAQARLSTTVLTVLPIGFGVWSLATSGAVRAFVVTPTGMMCVAIGLAFNIAGWWWMRRTIGAIA